MARSTVSSNMVVTRCRATIPGAASSIIRRAMFAVNGAVSTGCKFHALLAADAMTTVSGSELDPCAILVILAHLRCSARSPGMVTSGTYFWWI